MNGRPEDEGSIRNVMIAIVISLAIFIPYQFFVLSPMEQKAQAAQEAARVEKVEKAKVEATNPPPPPLTRAQVLEAGPRIKFDSPSMDGSFVLQQGRIDDLSLKRYRLRVDPTSPEVVFLSPTGAGATSGAFGWTTDDGSVDVIPAWTAPEGAVLTPQTPVTLSYETGDGLKFTRTISLDDDYLFTLVDKVENQSATARSLRAYGAVQRRGLPADLVKYPTVHEGFTGVIGDQLFETDYSNAEKVSGQNAEELAEGRITKGGWLGITDKYWLAAAIPNPQQTVTARYKTFTGPDGVTIYEAGYIGEPQAIPAQGSITTTQRLFAGAKRVEILRSYEKQFNITRLDSAVDWGNFYFLTRPFFAVMEFFFKLVGHFGVAILLTTIVVKAVMFPLVYQSYKSMSKLRLLQPKMQDLQKRYANEKEKLQQEMIKLYQTERINPVAGCLPMLLQIPIFYALYKVLMVTIEMRHTPFFGWINDLSAPDPTSWINLFGLLPFNAPTDWPVVGFLFAVGAWPIMYGLTMWAVTSLSPQAVTDPIQKAVFQFMPLIFTFMFATFAAGLVIYWTWSNFISIIQQYVIMRRQGVETEFDKWLAKMLSGAPKPAK